MRVTTDGAQNWSEPRGLPDSTMTGYAFLDADHGYLGQAVQVDGTGPFVVWTTSDGGLSWQSKTIAGLAAPAGGSVVALVHFTDVVHGIALAGQVIEQQVAFQSCTGSVTDDGGDTWTGVPDAPCDTAVWWAGQVGVVQPDRGAPAIRVTRDGGRTWRDGELPGVGDGVQLGRERWWLSVPTTTGSPARTFATA